MPLIALVAASLLATPDPVVLQVNLREVRLSELERAVDEHRGDVKAALRALAIRELLLQEAAHSGLGAGLPEAPGARAQAFLERVISARSVCGNLSERAIAEMYRVMKPRFVRGHLYDVAELRWSCPADFSPEAAGCREQAHRYADEVWRPLAPAITDRDDLRWLGLLTAADAPLRYVELTFHVDENGRASVPAHIAEAITPLEPGEAAVTADATGARLHLLADHRLPIDRQLGDPGVEAEVRAELCPRILKANREEYVDGLLRSAALTIHRDRLPANLRAALPDEPTP